MPAVPGARTIEELDADFQANHVTADAENQGKTLIVSGIVNKVTVNDSHDIYYFILEGRKPVTWTVRCAFSRKNGLDLYKLKTGSPVVVQGEYAGYGRNIILKDCVLLRY